MEKVNTVLLAVVALATVVVAALQVFWTYKVQEALSDVEQMLGMLGF